MSISLGNYKFLDARNHVPPDINLSKFAKMWGVREIEKELFPYEWFDSPTKLEHKEFLQQNIIIKNCKI